MEIVPISNKKLIGLEVIIQRKAELKRQIIDQRIQISENTMKMFSFSSFSANFLSKFNKGVNLIEGVMLGFKIAKSIRSIFRKFK